MQFQVPQFIDVEDKIFGPFTFKQFIYLIGGAGASFALFKLLPIYFSIPLIIPIVALALALTFFKVNNRPFIAIMESAVNYYIGAKLYIWKQKLASKKKEESKKEDDGLSNFNYVPKLSNSKLKDLSWSLDVLDMEKKKKNEQQR